MPTGRESLLAGRNTVPLTADEIRRAYNAFQGMDSSVAVRYQAGAHTCFHVGRDEREQEVPEIVFGDDIYPGRSVIDANSAMSMPATVAHELAHFHRWLNRTELPDLAMEHLDEALTDLDAIARFPSLSHIDVRQLAADAAQRLHLFTQPRQPLPR